VRRPALPRSAKHRSLTTLREKLIKTGAKVGRHAKYVTFQLAEVAVPRELFAMILDRIQRFSVRPLLLQPRLRDRQDRHLNNDRNKANNATSRDSLRWSLFPHHFIAPPKGAAKACEKPA